MFPPKLTMPIDMALPLYLSQEEFGYRTTSKNYQPDQNSCLTFEHSHCIDQIEANDNSINETTRKTKKQVTFADHKGLSLTRVKIFSEFNDQIDIPASVQEMLNAAITQATEEDQLVLDFPQPSSDYLHFRQCLENNYVCLEHCVLKEKVLAGTIKVKNVSFEKSVNVRVTFDTWKSHADIGCKYIKDTYPSSYSDTFSFEVSIPDNLRLHERIEFAISYEVAGCKYWDSNEGKNYRILWSSMKKRDEDSCHNESLGFGIHFDRYGSPTCSHGIFPDWPSYANYENIGPYY
ncbi:protein phosphatase 1 regulatory subunit 3B [Boleophthalmus pectinirostris]|uniref:protein phosphatase 1 regulatory subunit 3B n=1 Tax=Boleophthalmus pectinirostris TaxID=150288 RepID=UPI000A1C2232|nr:protein phosphatase 1 regulatory subunit 3B [Boleophthalmus pectinirostris]